MKIEKMHYLGMGIGLIIILISFLFSDSSSFYFFIGMGVIIASFPFVFSAVRENAIDNEKEEMFLEFARNLVESVKTGTPISKSIINMKSKSFGVLTPHIKKLANQISIGIPLTAALKVFDKDVNNKTVSRAVTLIGEAERAGGDIGKILEAVAGAVSLSDKLKKERKATISTLVTQGYIIFFVFIIIILVMQFKIIPMISGISNVSGALTGGASASTAQAIDSKEISNSFFYLLLVQGFFSGLAIGKLAEGNIKAGIRHSFVLVLMSFLISATANAYFGV
jgi:archaeal flagellar protein FlaJ